MTKSTGVDNCGARRAAVFPDLPTLRDNPSQPRRATRRRTASTLSRLFGPTPAMRSRARARLPASAAATLALLLVASACVASAGATRPSLGLESMGTEACAETRAFCEGTVMDAVRADAKLVAFLTDARDSAASSSADADVSLADAHRATAASGALKFPELLALGCRLTAGEAAPRTSSPEPPTTTSTPPDLPPTRPPPPRRFSSWPRPTPTRRDYPPRGSAANAFACQPLGAASRCGRELVQLYRRAGTEGFDIGTVRAGEILLARYAGDRVDPSAAGAGEVIPESALQTPATTITAATATTRHPPRATPVDAADARILFKSLLAGDLDRRAAARLRELATVEEMRVASRPDEACLAADALVRVVGRWLRARGGVVGVRRARGATDDARSSLSSRASPPRGMGARGDRRAKEKVAKGSGELSARRPSRARAEGEGRGARAERRERAKREQRRRKQS